jgi:hypothetical protein
MVHAKCIDSNCMGARGVYDSAHALHLVVTDDSYLPVVDRVGVATNGQPLCNTTLHNPCDGGCCGAW